MGWRGDEQRELKERRDFKRKPWRDLFFYRARGMYWAAALAILFALYIGAQFG
jgi:hypothetical protein